MIVADPWYDYIALPVAPLVLLLQVGTLFLRERWMRWAGGLACSATIVAMFGYIASIELAPDEGANIGAGVMLLWSAISVVLLGALALAEIARFAVRRLRRRPADAG